MRNTMHNLCSFLIITLSVSVYFDDNLIDRNIAIVGSAEMIWYFYPLIQIETSSFA